jgi:hypothetical protein
MQIAPYTLPQKRTIEKKKTFEPSNSPSEIREQNLDLLTRSNLKLSCGPSHKKVNCNFSLQLATLAGKGKRDIK